MRLLLSVQSATVVATLALLPFPLVAQSFGTQKFAAPGDSLRVLGTNHVMQHGEFLRSESFRLTLLVEDREMHFEPEAIQGVERYRNPDRFRKFAGPLIIGAGLGGAIGALSWSQCTRDCLLHPDSRFEQAVVGAAVAGLVGGVIGVVRAAKANPGWEDVGIPHTAGEFVVAPTPVGSTGFGFRFPIG